MEHETVNFDFLTRSWIHNDIVPLQRQCLNAIVNNFELFNQAFLSSSDDSLQGNIYFLRKNYSKVLLQELYSNGSFRSPHLKFLVNEHLRDLKICSLPIRSSSEIIKVIQEIGHSLDSLEFDTLNPIEESGINSCIPYLQNVKKIKICSDCTNKTLKLITSSCPKLEELEMVFTRESEECAFSNAGSSFLCSVKNGVLYPNTNLKKLSFSSYGTVQNPITSDDVAFLLDHLKALESLDHPDLPIVVLNLGRERLLDRLIETKQFRLSSLDLTDFVSTSIGKEILRTCLEMCPCLQQLHMLIKKEELLYLIAKFPKLERLKLVDMKRGINLDRFLEEKGRALKVLKIYNFVLSADVLISNCHRLEYLCLSNVTLNAEEGRSAEGQSLNRMQKFYVQYSHKLVSRKPLLKILKCCNDLKKLSFGNDILHNLETIAAISRFLADSVVEKVSFRKCYIHPVFLASVLLNCSHLKTLHLVYMKNLYESIVDDLFEYLPCKKHCVKIIYCDCRDWISTSDSEDDEQFLWD